MKRRPNGSGTISKCDGRRKPWKAVSPAVYNGYDLTSSGRVRSKRIVIGYFHTRKEAENALAEYASHPFNVSDSSTFADIFSRWIEKKENAGKSSSTLGSYRAAFSHCASVHDKIMRRITLDDLLLIFRMSAGSGKSTVNNIKIVIDGVFSYAERHDLIGKNPARLIDSEDMNYTIPAEEKHRIFTPGEISAVLSAPSDVYTDCTVILLYTGFRVEELLTMTSANVSLDEMTFTGGMKTAAGRNRIVPIHPDIEPLVTKYVQAERKKLFPTYQQKLRDVMRERWGHLPHDTRHTFVSRLKSAGADNVCVERLVGHASKSITDSVYTHKDIEELRRTVLMLDYKHLNVMAQ